MDAFTQLALIAKAKRVFETEDTFLSFPALSPIVYEPGELAFAAPGDMTPQSLALMSEFARITNAIPRGAIAPQEEGEYLWDVYGDVLETAQLARGDLSSAETARYQAAMSLLYTRSADGLSFDSDAYTTYKQHRDAHIAALEDYRNRQLSAESSDDPAAQTKWRDEEEPRLRDGVRQCEERWLIEGRKSEVEEALQVEQACAARAPSLVWDDWKTSFMADLDTETDTSLINFAATGFSPYDFYDDDGWPRFTLTRPEMARLVEGAPRELVESLGSSADEDIRSVTFEYRSVAVMRPWFRPALFKSRVWRLPNGAEALSEGTAMRGRCPAYIAAIVFGRNINVDRRQPAATLPPSHGQRTDTRVPQRGPDARDHRSGARDHRAASGNRRVVVRESRTRPRTHIPAANASAPRPVVRVRPARSVRVNRAGFASIRPRSPLPARPVPSAPRVASAPQPTSELTVLAFICKQLSRCPDPDPQLSWHDGVADDTVVVNTKT